MSEDRLVPLSADNEAEKSSRVRRAFEGGRTNEFRIDVGPRTVGQILDQALDIFKRGFFRYVFVTAVVFLPERIVQAMFGHHVFMKVAESGGGEFPVGTFVYFIGSAFFTVLMNYVAFALLARMAFNDLYGRPGVTSADVWLLAKRFPMFLVLAFVVSLGQMSGGLLCCIGALVTGWKLQLVIYAYLLENQSFVNSIRRGLTLSEGSFLRYVGLAFAAWVLTFTWRSMANTPFSSGVRENMQDAVGLDGIGFDLLFVPLATLLLAVGVAYFGILWVVYYADQRVRLDGLDLTLKLDELELADSGPEAENGR